MSVDEDNQSACDETLYLSSIPGMVEKIEAARNELSEDLIPLDEMDW